MVSMFVRVGMAMRVVIIRVVRRHGVVVLMAVVPQLGFVEQKEKHQPAQQHGKEVVGTGLALEGFGQQMQKSRGHEGACGQAQHVLGKPGQHGKAQGGSKPDAAYAGGDGSHQNRDQSHVE